MWALIVITTYMYAGQLAPAIDVDSYHPTQAACQHAAKRVATKGAEVRCVYNR